MGTVTNHKGRVGTAVSQGIKGASLPS